MTMIYYKELNPEEVYEYLYLLENNYSPSLSKRIDEFDSYVKKLSIFATNYGVYDDMHNKCIGYIGFYTNNIELGFSYVSQLVVDCSVQKLGIGKSLLKICERVSKSKGFKFIKLEVRKDNENAILFYKKNGFKMSEETEKTFIMIKSLEVEND